MKKNQNNLEVIKLAQKGDLAAFEKILLDYERKVFSFIFRMVNNIEDAEDLTQDTFIKIYKKLHTFDPDQSFSNWVFAIAANTTRDFFRKKKRRKELFIIDDPKNSFETIYISPAYKGLRSKSEIKIDLEFAFKKIKPIYKTIILLCYKEGLTYKEISKKLKLPLNTVKTYLYRAKQTLKKQLNY